MSIINYVACIQWKRKCKLYLFHNLIERTYCELQKLNKNNTTKWNSSTWIGFVQCDEIRGQTPKTQGIEGVIDIGHAKEDLEVVVFKGSSGTLWLDLNNPIELYKYQTLPKNLQDKRLLLKKSSTKANIEDKRLLTHPKKNP